MSVTVSVEAVYTGRMTVSGYSWADDTSEAVTLATFATEAEYRAYVGNQNRDLLWTGYDWFVRNESVTENAPSVNMSNYNARAVFSALELDTQELWGSESASTFRERVLLAMAGYDGNDGEAPYTFAVEGSATVHHMGRPDGYVAEKLAGLLAVAETAEKMGLNVVWS